MIQRTVSIVDSLHRMVQSLRAEVLKQYDLDMDYPSAVNFILLLGTMKLTSGQMSKEEQEAALKFLKDNGTKLEIAAYDFNLADVLKISPKPVEATEKPAT